MLFQCVFRLHVCIAVLTLIWLVVRMCLDMSLEFRLCCKGLIIQSFAACPLASESATVVLLQLVNVVFVNVSVKIRRIDEALTAETIRLRVSPTAYWLVPESIRPLLLTALAGSS